MCTIRPSGRLCTYPKFSHRIGSGETEIFLNMASDFVERMKSQQQNMVGMTEYLKVGFSFVYLEYLSEIRLICSHVLKAIFSNIAINQH